MELHFLPKHFAKLCNKSAFNYVYVIHSITTVLGEGAKKKSRTGEKCENETEYFVCECVCVCVCVCVCEVQGGVHAG